MNRKLPAPSDVPPEVSSLQRQVERWRQERRHREPMPEQLWHSAARLAHQHSVARISRWIRLDYYALKERVDSIDPDSAAGRANGPAFVELAMAPSAALPECVVELEHPGGGRMRIHVKGACVPDLAALSRSFWGAES